MIWLELLQKLTWCCSHYTVVSVNIWRCSQVYVESILALQKKACIEQGKAVLLELVIMTSDDTHAKTKDLLDRNTYFGMKHEQLHLLKQEKVRQPVCAAGCYFLQTSEFVRHPSWANSLLPAPAWPCRIWQMSPATDVQELEACCY